LEISKKKRKEMKEDFKGKKLEIEENN